MGENKGTTRERVSETRLSRPVREEDKKFVEKEEKQKRSIKYVYRTILTYYTNCQDQFTASL